MSDFIQAQKDALALICGHEISDLVWNVRAHIVNQMAAIEQNMTQGMSPAEARKREVKLAQEVIELVRKDMAP